MQNERATPYPLDLEALKLITGTLLAPTLSERKLLGQFLRGAISLKQLRALAEHKRQTTQAVDKLRQLAAGDCVE